MQPECLQDYAWLSELGLTRSQERLVHSLFEENPPQFHSWLLGAANRMRSKGASLEQTYHVLAKRSDGHKSRSVLPSEIKATVKKAYASDSEIVYETVLRSEFSRLSVQAKLRSLMDSSDWPSGYGLSELLDDAPALSLQFCQESPETLLGGLFRNHWAGTRNQFLCVGRRLEDGRGYYSETLPWIDEIGWLIPEWANLVVPNLANARSGTTQEGKRSKRSKDMFPNRHYLVLESDLGFRTEDTQAALIRFAGKILDRRPAMVVHSGSKSLHSWWDVRGVPEESVVGLLDEMGGLFDPAGKTRSQLFRLPNGFREGEDEAKQVALFFDYEAVLEGKPRRF